MSQNDNFDKIERIAVKSGLYFEIFEKRQVPGTIINSGNKVKINGEIFDLYEATNLIDERKIDNIFGDKMGYFIEDYIIDEDEDENSFLAKARNNKFRDKYFTGIEAQNDIPTTSSPKTVNDLINITMAGIPSFDEITLEAIQNEKYVKAMFDYITSGTTGYSDFKESFPEEKDMRENLKKAYEEKHGKIILGRSEEIYKTVIEHMIGIRKEYASSQEKSRAEGDIRIYKSWEGKKFLELVLSGFELLPSDKEKALRYFIESGIWKVYSKYAFGPQTTPYWSDGKTVGGEFTYNGENVADYIFDSRFYKDTTEQMELIRKFFKELSLKTPVFSNYQDVKWTDTNKNLKIEPGELHIELSINGQPKTYDLNTVINGSIR